MASVFSPAILVLCMLLSSRYKGFGIAGVFYCYTTEILTGFDFITPVFMVMQIALNANRRSISSIIRLSLIDVSVCFFLVYVLLSAFWSTDQGFAILEATRVISVCGLFYLQCRLAIANVGPERIAWQTAIAFCSLGFAFAIVTISAAPRDLVGSRLVIGEGSAVGLAQPLPYVLFSAVYLVASGVRKWTNSALPAILTLAVVGYYAQMNGTRGVLVAFAAGFLSYFTLFILRSRPAKSLISAIGAFYIALIVFVVFLSFGDLGSESRLLNFSSYGSAGDASSIERIYRFAAAKKLFWEWPVFGSGAGGYNLHTIFDYPHNLFLEVAADFGLVGVLLILFIILSVGICFFRYGMLHVSGAPFFLTLFVIAFVHQQVSFSLSSGKAIFVIGILAGISSALQPSRLLRQRYVQFQPKPTMLRGNK
ncbi:O-antigen ligase family protein [Ciceribacter selenitireducens]